LTTDSYVPCPPCLAKGRPGSKECDIYRKDMALLERHARRKRHQEKPLDVWVDYDDLDGHWIAGESSGAMSQGKTQTDALRNLADAIDAIAEVKAGQS
jgi:Lon protease-like protein